MEEFTGEHLPSLQRRAKQQDGQHIDGRSRAMPDRSLLTV